MAFEVNTDAEFIAQRQRHVAAQIPEAILRKTDGVALPITVQRRVIALIGQADADDRFLVECLRQQRKGEGTLLLFEVDVFDLIAVLRDQT